MRRYNYILVPYDGTMSTEYTLRASCRIARWNYSHVLVVVPFVSWFSKRGVEDEIVSNVDTISRQEDIKMEVMFQDGRPSDTIIDVSYKKGNDLIVIGKTSMSGLERVVMGSFTGRIIGYSNCDIIVVPEDAPLRWKRILLCTDGSKYSHAAVDNSIAYAKFYGGSIDVLSIVDLTDEFYAQSPDGADKLVEKAMKMLKGIVESADGSGVSITPIVREGESFRKILEVAEKTEADIIFMGSHERVGFGSLIMGSVARRVAMNAACPVFIVKP